MTKFVFLLLLVSTFASTQAQWVNIGQVTGTGANYPTISVVSDSVVWIAGGTGGVASLWRSTNGGTNYFEPVDNTNRLGFCQFGFASSHAKRQMVGRQNDFS